MKLSLELPNGDYPKEQVMTDFNTVFMLYPSLFGSSHTWERGFDLDLKGRSTYDAVLLGDELFES